ncbi:zinc finger CCHC domain-containing protein 8 homolog [Monomorium pharaonis]|uniref:zinc finger CCHC domain-containing protein 8 homolog n=1 Tax=Monomorium pharaonis TaxID=307658 RepID=UPI0017473151|nr:zinc finger CCHC domain-containing protein 8 homolog [Monomorium pharaonis]
MDSDVRVINVSTDTTISLDGSITIEDSETEVIELVDTSCEATSYVDTSCEAASYVDDENPVYGRKDPGSVSSFPEDVETAEMTESPSACTNNVAPQPIFKVMFRDESASRRYRQQVKDFLHALVRSKPCHEKDENKSSLILEIWNDKVEDEEKNDNDLSNNATECDGIDDLFTIDKQPNVKNDLDVPTYGQKYENTFEESNNETPKDFAPRLNCFNCNGNHVLRDCPLPKNQSNINKNRKEYALKSNMGVRYHTNEDQRFGHMVPGQLSQKLRKALGLKDDELPKHIYRMRLLGYPPGWLEEARLQHSGLALFNSDGVAEKDVNEEEGEIITQIDKDQYDLKKIYDFPGFNVPPPPGTIDDSHKYWVPQMQSTQSKQIMLLHLQGKEADDGYKRKKLKLPPPINNVNTIETSDMEVETLEENVVENVSINGHFVPPLPKESLEIPPIPPPEELPQPVTDDSDSQSQELPSSESADDNTSITNSPSLSELERTKKALLMEIEEANSQSNSNSILTKNDSNTAFVSEMSFSNITATSSTLRKSSNQDSVKSNLQCCPDISLINDFNTTITLDTSGSDKCLNVTPVHSTPQRSLDTSQASVKSIHLGTPLLPSTSPYSKLPSSEKFSRDICDVINFENLPDSTGKYEQMTGVLQKVRSTMARLYQQE